MPRRWQAVPLLPLGSGGEESDSAPGRKGVTSGFPQHYPKLRRLHNGYTTGPGVVEQFGDWLLADTCKNGSSLENHAVCGIFPFTQQGGASATVAGVAFSFNATDHAVYLHQVSEDLKILRTFTAYSSFTGTLPPQITGFEMFGKFYFNAYAREAASSRHGMAVFDPTGAGSITIPTYSLIGGTAATLKFRGISNHRGSAILGWGYLDENDIDFPHIVRFPAYTIPDTWVPDTNLANEQTAGFFAVGTLNVPVIACAMSDQYTILGKETEVFALDGDWSSTYNYRQIGTQYGPVSTAGMVSIGSAAVWMSAAGPAYSSQGGPVQLLGMDQILRKFLNYFDLPSSWAAHDSSRHRVVFGLRRQVDDNGNAVTSPYLTEILAWDYLRNEFHTQSPPNPFFCLGTVRGPGLNLVGPSGTVSAITATFVQSVSAGISWTPGDTSPDVTFTVQYRVHGTATWLQGPSNVGSPMATLSGLSGSSTYDVRVAQIRNSQTSAYTESDSLFTTLAVGTPQDPTSVVVTETGNTTTKAGKTYSQVQVTFTPFSVPNSVVRLYQAETNSIGAAFVTGSGSPDSGSVTDVTYELVGAQIYYWVRNEMSDGSAQSNYVPASPAPYTVVGGA